MHTRVTTLISLVVALFLAGNVQADTQFFDSDPADHLWTTVGNWDDGLPINRRSNRRLIGWAFWPGFIAASIHSTTMTSLLAS